MSPRWHSLPTRNISAPLLLYSFIYTSQSYEFFLTDLTHIWHENLQYKHVLQKAEDIGTSIDPSEDANQYDVFMRKIQDALDGANNTGVTIASGHKSDSVVVTTSTKLPAGLNPLKWTFTLSKEPPSAVTRHLLLPLLKSERNHEQREQSLLEHIREKDNILSKIFDKIDPSQLTSMFPGTAGVRHTKPKTSDLIRHIKGATRFDEKGWRGSPAGEDNTANGLAESVYAHGGFTSLDTASTRYAAWWKSLDDVKDAKLQSQERSQAAMKENICSPDTGAAGKEQVTADEDLSTEDEDEFQHQETPLHLKRKKDQADRKPVEDSESDIGVGTTESDQDAESDDGLDDIKAPIQKPPKKAMGRIGGPKAVPLGRPRKESVADETDSDSEPKPRQRTAATREELELDDGTESDSEPERMPTPSPVKAKKETPTETAPKKKGVLGKIGGKKPEPKKVPSSEPADTNDIGQPTSDEDDLNQRQAPSKPQPTLKRGKKLGLIGGGKKKPQAAAPKPEPDETDEDLDTGPITSTQKQKVPSTSPPPPPAVSSSPSPIRHRVSKAEPEPELSAEQKANKKREELKRQLDAKSKAPTKKKRKF
ncbi:hypothetical protein TMatcc_008801 [Talaromyces marneffei ATCC 18224]|uniref:Non-homologous end-joining factor 1 n=1 Tax=Talaromyces marneffei (strain ATCC 18224 / CBS 334.59 / QM 7333) TaxID=441960 RepID=B6QL01_TALMQ|nr:uncharacterized protein EYB26_008116 [Talaromyces marneffei]EEA21778.1 conserved hypothetical protein [Talaromyces marneffei ATCC 18224]KAE8550747.1 hypothetical protein EYB25_006975 [Talaromyces marneffei]QGA20414.1 hypothetical protein EYB26_008116 [Talaromyces marneffei]